jgi:Cu+-exporting ATPase
MVKDLVCGMEIEEAKSGATYDYEGRTYYFCAPECKDQFIDLMSPQSNSFRDTREGALILGDD